MAEEKVEATLQNYSRGGFCIESRTAYVPGQAIRIILPEPVNRDIDGEVQWQMALEDAYVLGCRFAAAKDHQHLQKASHLIPDA